MDAAAGKLNDKKQAEAGLTELKGLIEGGDKKTVIEIFEFMDRILEQAAAKEKGTASACEELVKTVYGKVEWKGTKG